MKTQENLKVVKEIPLEYLMLETGNPYHFFIKKKVKKNQMHHGVAFLLLMLPTHILKIRLAYFPLAKKTNLSLEKWLKEEMNHVL